MIWAFKQLHDKGLAYEGYRVLPYCWRDETPLSNHELRMDDDVYKMRQDQSVTVTFPLDGAKAESLGLTARQGARLDDDPVDPADQPRARRRARRRVLGAAERSARRGRRFRGGRRRVPARDRHDRGLREGPRLCDSAEALEAVITARLLGARARGRALRPSLGLLRGHRGVGHARTPGRSSSPTTSPRARAPGSCTRLPHTVRTTRSCAPRPASRSSCRSTTAASSCPIIDGCRGPAGLRREQAAHPEAARRRPPAAAWRATSTATRTAGAAATRSSTRPCRAGSCACPSSATAWASSTRRSTGFPTTSRTASSASGSATPATGRSAATGTGAARSRCGRATTPTTRASTSTARSTSSRPTSACAPDATCTAPSSTS